MLQPPSLPPDVTRLRSNDREAVPRPSSESAAESGTAAEAETEPPLVTLRTAYEVSQALKALREKESPDVAARRAPPLVALFPEDPWVRTRHGWILYDLAKADLDRDPERALRTLRDLTTLAAELPNPGLFPDTLARLYARLVNALKGSQAAPERYASSLAELGHRLGESLPPSRKAGQRDGQRDGKRALPSPYTSLVGGLRKALELAERWGDLAELCRGVLQGTGERRPGGAPDPTWFLRSLLEALRRLDPTAPLPSDVQTAIVHHGGNEHVQVSLARYLDERGDPEAHAAWARALALARSPWTWRAYADRQGRRGAAPAAEARVLRGALWHVAPPDRDKTWGLHARLAELAAADDALGDATAEAFLSRALRLHAGWPPAPAERLIADLGLGPAVAALERAEEPRQLLRDRCQSVYRPARLAILRELAEPGTVTARIRDGKLAFVRRPGGGPDAVLRPARGAVAPPVQTAVLVIAIAAWDRKRSREGAQVAWWEAADANREQR